MNTSDTSTGLYHTPQSTPQDFRSSEERTIEKLNEATRKMRADEISFETWLEIQRSVFGQHWIPSGYSE